MVPNQKSVLELRAVEISAAKISFLYRAKDHDVTRSIIFPDSTDLTIFKDDPIFMKLVQYGALADCIYMFNFDYFDQIDIPFSVTDSEKRFFEKTYFNGLAEFRYTNGIALNRAVQLQGVISTDALSPATKHLETARGRAFVLNGGGKDGAVAMEIAKRLELDIAWFSSGRMGSRDGIVAASGVNDWFVVQRQKDLESPLERIYDGHKPMSLYVAMVSSLCAYINKRYYVIAANEYSASFPNLHVDGMAINHQYSKSFEFESDLKNLFTQSGIPVRYFSIARPLYELQIVKLFSDFDQYHESFISCNRGIHHDEWCLECAKCAFVVGAMYHFVPAKAAAKWGELHELCALHPQFVDELIELINPHQKPFECIGTTEENLYLLSELMPRLSLTPEQQYQYETYLAQSSASQSPLVLENPMAVNDFPSELSGAISRTIGELL